MSKFFSIILLCFYTTLQCTGQVHNIALSDVQSSYQPEHFYIKHVVDNRQNKSNIGHINTGAIDLQGGLAEALSAYIHNAPQNKNGTGVNMLINDFEITEKSAGGRKQYDLKIGIAYYAGTAKLVAYNGSAYAQATSYSDSHIDELIRSNITNNLKEFDQWMSKNKHTIATEPTLNIVVNFARNTDKKNQIIYSKNRKLYITDFEGEPDNNIVGAAATLSGIGMNYQSSTLRNKTDVTVTVSIYFDKSRSWMKSTGKNATTLMHEQKHFDITAIKACELRELIKNTEFDPANYQQQLKDMLDRIQAEAAVMQNKYDAETEHGTIIDKQAEWEKKIDEMLDRQPCY